jgi:hypothetical protein
MVETADGIEERTNVNYKLALIDGEFPKCSRGHVMEGECMSCRRAYCIKCDYTCDHEPGDSDYSDEDEEEESEEEVKPPPKKAAPAPAKAPVKAPPPP